MCFDPITIGALTITPAMAVSTAAAVVSYIGGQQAAVNQAEAKRENLLNQYKQNEEKQKQINEASAIEQMERDKQGRIDRAETRVTSGEAGALGFTSKRLLADSFMQQGTDIQSMERNRQNAIKQTINEGEGYKASAQGKTNVAYSQAPTVLGTGLQIAGDYLDSTAKVDNATKSSYA